MKKTLFTLALCVSFIFLGGIFIASAQDKVFLEKRYQEEQAKDKLGHALKAEKNQQVIEFSVESSCMKEKAQEPVKNVMDVKLSSSDILVIRAGQITSSGYGWYPVGLKDNVVSMAANSLEPAKGVGMTEVRRFVFKGTAKGETTLRLVYHRPWENKAPLKEYEIHVVSEGKYTGEFNFIPEPDVVPPPPDAANETEKSLKAYPANFDWRDQGVVTSIKDQGQTGACWAFGACASFEAVIGIKTGASVNLSEQWLCNCNSYGMDCQYGGWFPQYMFKNYGAVYESQLPFYGYNYTCYSYTYHERATSWGYTSGISDYPVPYYYHSATNEQIKQRIYDYGPIAAMTYCDDWSYYTGGIWYGHTSTGGHIVSIVGWNDSGGYWIIKNSWGSSWGENGYMRLAYNRSYMGRTSVWITMTATTCDLSVDLHAEAITETTATLDWVPPASGGHTAWNVQYRQAGTSTWTNGNTSVSYYHLSGLTPGTTYEWRVQTICSGVSDWTAISSFTTAGGSTCGMPAGLQSSNVTETSATVSWNAVSGANSYDVEYRATGTSTWSNLNTSSASATLSGLIADTEYEFRVRANCSAGSSDFSSTANFMTMGGASGIIAWDDFESGTTSGGAGWEANWSLPSSNASVSTTGAVYGSYNLRCVYNGYADRKINLSGYTNVTMEFDVKGYAFETSDEGRIYFWNGSSWARVYTMYDGQDNNTYSHKTVNLTNITGSTHYIRVESACSSTSDYFYVDNIEIKASPAASANIATSSMEESMDKLTVFPNPASDELTVIIPEDGAVVELISLAGRIVFQGKSEGAMMKIDVSDLPPGVYNLRITSGGDVWNKKVVVF